MNLGTIWLGIRGDTKPAQKDIDKLKRKATQSAKDIEQKTTRSLSTMTKYWKLYAVAAVAALGLVARSFIKAASTAENYMVRLKVLLRSTEEGNRLFKAMAGYASTVSFQYEEIMGAATALAGVMKGGVDEIKRWMPMIADLAAVTGLSLQDATGQVIRMYSAGAAAADMFRERGVLAMMGFKAKTQYTVEATRKMMFEAWQKMDSQFKDASKELAKTWSGLMSMLGDKWFQFRNLVMSAGVYDALKDALGDINDKFRIWIENNREMIAQKVPGYVKSTTESIQALYNILSKIIGLAIRHKEILAGGIVGYYLFGPKGMVILAGLGAFVDLYKTIKKEIDKASKAKSEAVKFAEESIRRLEGEKRILEDIIKLNIQGGKYLAKQSADLEAINRKLERWNTVLASGIEKQKRLLIKPKMPTEFALRGPARAEAPMIDMGRTAEEFLRQWQVMIRDLSPIPREYWAAEAAEFIRQYNVAIRDLPSPDIKLKGVIELTGIQKLQSWINSFIGVGKVWLKQVTKGGKIWYEQVEASTLKLKIGFLSAALSLMASFVSFADWISAIVAFVRGFLGITERIVKEVGSLFEDLPGLITKFFDYLGKIFSQLIPSIIKQLPEIIEAFWEGFSGFWEQMIGSIPRIIEAFIENFPQMMEAFIKGFLNAWVTIFQCILRLWEWIFAKIWEWILGILTWIDETWLGGFFGRVWEKFKEGVGDFWETIKEGVGGWWEELKTGIGGYWEKLKEGIGGFWEKFKESIGDLWESIKTGVGGFWETMKEGIGGFWEKIKEGIGNFWEKMKEALLNALGVGGGGGGGISIPGPPGLPDIQIGHEGGIPRAHAGILARDEVPIIAQTGERVLSREQNRAFESGAIGEQQGGDRTVILEVDGAELGRATFGRLEFDGEAVERVRGVI